MSDLRKQAVIDGMNQYKGGAIYSTVHTPTLDQVAAEKSIYMSTMDAEQVKEEFGLKLSGDRLSLNGPKGYNFLWIIVLVMAVFMITKFA